MDKDSENFFQGVRTAVWFFIASVALVTMILTACPARAAEWDTTDKVLFGSLVVLEVIDTAQTWQIHRHPDKYVETNPLFGKNPNMGVVVGVKSLLVSGAYYVTRDMPSGDRKLLLGLLDAIQLTVVAHNYSVGVKLGF
jgi:hypothetical protein